MEKQARVLTDYIHHIKDMIRKIEKYTTGISSYEKFIANEMIVDACITALIQIGEMAGCIGKYHTQELEIPYKKIINFRNILVHVYHKIDTMVIWDTIQKSIPKLKRIIDTYLKENK